MKQLGDYFKYRILSPVREWQLEADTNKEFYLGTKEFEFVPTLLGHEPVSMSLHARFSPIP